MLFSRKKWKYLKDKIFYKIKNKLLNILLIFQGKYDIIFDITKKGNVKMNIEEKLLQAKAEVAFQKVYNDFKEPFSETLNKNYLFFQDKQLKNKTEDIYDDFKKSFSKNLDEIFSIFEDKKFIKRFQNNQIYIFKDTEMLILDPIRSDKTCQRVFDVDFYRITYQENKLVIEYFVLNPKNVENPEFVESIEKWNIKDFNFCENLENFDIKYEIRLGKENSFKFIKKQENSNFSNERKNIFLEGTFGKLFIKALEFCNINSDFAKDIIKLYYENKITNADFKFMHEIDEKDFKRFKSLSDFLSFKYNIPSTRKLRKLPLSIMEEIFKDEFLRLDENNHILNFISKNKETFLAKRIEGIFLTPKGIAETYFDASGTYDKFYNSKIQEYEILEEKARKSNQLPAYARRRKGTEKYVKEILRDTFNLGKNLNIRNIVKRIEKCNNFQNLENLHNKLVKKINEQKSEKILKYKINIPEKNIEIGNFIIKKFKENWNEGNIEFITKLKRLYLEGLEQSNCIYTYLSMIENGKCIILSYKEKEHALTIEVIINENKFYVNQCLERFNERTEKAKEIEEKINSLNNLYSF